jgi:hypothetical protein
MKTIKLDRNDIFGKIKSIKKLHLSFDDVNENLINKALTVEHSFEKVDITNVSGFYDLRQEFIFSEDDNERVDIIHKLIKYYQKALADNEPEEYLNNIIIEAYSSSIFLNYEKGKILVSKQLLERF